MEQRFRVLRIIGTIYKVLAWIALALGGLGALGASVLGGARIARRAAPWARVVGGIAGGIMGALGILLVAILYFLILYAAGEFVYLALAIEKNTRETAYYLRGKKTPSPQ